MDHASATALRIGALARRAGVGVETIRYYQRRRLLGTPPKPLGGHRVYSLEFVERLMFIRRAQALGFALNDIAMLLTLNDGVDHARARKIALERMGDIAARIADLRAMYAVLERLVHDCEHASGRVPCPIIAAIRDDEDSRAAGRKPRGKRR